VVPPSALVAVPGGCAILQRVFVSKTVDAPFQIKDYLFPFRQPFRTFCRPVNLAAEDAGPFAHNPTWVKFNVFTF
jgi:hypothetical protein